MNDKQYEVAISFAGEQRPYAEALSRHLSQYGIAHFYDAENEALLWGKNLAEEFHGIYTRKTRYVLMLISKEYIDKQWCRHERRSAISEGLKRTEEFILPVQLDSVWPDGIPTDVHRVDGRKKAPAEVAALIAEKLGISLYSKKASLVPPPKSASWIGQVAFDYESFNGRFIIGDEGYAFETAWSTGGPGAIHTLNDGANVNGIAIAHGIPDFGRLFDVSLLDFTSRARMAHVGNIVIYRNNNGLYAALKIEEVTIRQGATAPNLRFWYAINRDGSADFSSFSIFD